MQCSIIITQARTARIGLPLALIHALDSLPSPGGAIVVEVSWFKQPTNEVCPPATQHATCFSLPPSIAPFFLSQMRSTASLVATRTAAWSGEGVLHTRAYLFKRFQIIVLVINAHIPQRCMGCPA
jgi:hypothetical protein